MRRFFLEGIDRSTKTAELTGEEFVHLKKVLRLGVGDEASVFNGLGLELTGRIESVEARSAVISIEGVCEGTKESPLELTLLQGLLKGDKPEFIVQKATELGLTEVCFFTTDRTVPRVDGEGAEETQPVEESRDRGGKTVRQDDPAEDNPRPLTQSRR